MNNQPIQIFQQTQAPRQDKSNVSTDRPAGEAFSRHLEKKLAADRPKNFLKPKNNHKPLSAAQPATPASPSKKTAKESASASDSANSLADLLAQLMAHLQAVAKEQGMQAGEYRLSKADEGIVTLMAESAGLDQASLSQMLDKLKNGELTLPDLFSTFSRHFQALSSDTPVTVPDTELPLLASILQRMGVNESTMDTVAAQAVTGDDQLDLAKFLQALDTVKAPESVVLSDVDREQLEALLAKAGATKEFPGKFFPGKDAQPMTLDLESLKDVLAQGLDNIDQNRPTADMPVFMNELKTLLSQAGFNEKDASWSPVVQKAMADVHAELSKIVDMSKVQAQKADDLAEKAENLAEGDPGPEKVGEDIKDMKDTFATDADTAAVTIASAEGKSETLAVPVEGSARENTLPGATPQAGAPSPAMAVTQDIHATRTATAPAHPLPHTTRALIFQQLTDGVQRGLKNQEHHLVLRLYPPELGEVKVDLLVRDDHVTVNFAMESQRVKDVIENSMQEFKDNLEQRGFVMNGCNVSVDQQGQGEDLWQRWLEAGAPEQMPSSRTVRNLSEENFYYRPPVSSGVDGVNLFV